MDFDKHLYDEAGNFKFKGRRLGLCALKCSNAGDFTYDVGALAPSMRFCKRCILKYGAMNLRKDANVALARTKRKTDAMKKDFMDLQKRYFEKFGTTLKIHLPEQAINRLKE